MNLSKSITTTLIVATAICAASGTLSAFGSVEWVAPGSDAPSFPLVANGRAAGIVLPPEAPEVVKIAAGDLAEDIESVTGTNPRIVTPGSGTTTGPKVILRMKDVGRWEAFRFSATPETLTIDGNDPRGLAFGIYELSRRIGVSPWNWWADVPVTKRKELHLSAGTDPIDQPAVKFRGIFINDEDWGLEPWSSKTFEPEQKGIGPKTYARVFELLLRLRANYLWPGMHPTTTPFHLQPGNADMADRYAIVVGSSHAEPMLRNNGGEWKHRDKEFNFLTHRDKVLAYWEERAEKRTNGESIFTIGMRGIHDSPIMGPRNQKERIETLEEVFAAQRDMLARHFRKPAAEIPQMFCPYKEVLDDYNVGLEVPDDVTIVWPDDNYGYVRRFPTAEETKRSGGLGVYYHVSYSGMPQSWLWIDTWPPAVTWSEMTRAYEQGSRTLWVVNCGDIKGCERSTEFFLDLAWHADRTAPEAPARFIRETAARDFGEKNADAIADILARMQAINFSRKTEHLQWHLSLTPYQPTELDESEIHERLDACAALLRDCEAVENQLPPESRDAFFQLVGYPVGITVAANERYFRAELARADTARGRSPDANRAAAGKGEERVDQLTARFNNEIAGGKWKHIVSENGYSPKAWPRFQRDTKAKRPEPTKDNVCPPAPPAAGELPRPKGAKPGDFVERDHVVSIHAGNYSQKSDLASGAGWRVIPGLGRSGNAVTVLPSTADLTGSTRPSISYRFHRSTTGPATLRVRLLPTHPLIPGDGLRLAVAIDDNPPVPLAVTAGFDTKRSNERFSAWQTRVISNATETSAEINVASGWHTLRLIAVDAGVVVDKITIEFGGLPASYEGPEETIIR
ncbi:MAG: glycosyl hydrolase 115 family protein [Verrucomicrobiae bacterium]|nr:glycosyl hydrolase 115 family protein [Verrucomicrobiae bacterium]